jgi:hypothetical protein
MSIDQIREVEKK